MRALCLLVCLLLIAKTKSLHSVDDFQFEVGDDLQVNFMQLPTSTLQYSIPHITAYAGKFIALAISKDVLTDKSSMFEINGVPEWLLFDSTTGIFQGVPSESDIENLNITLITHSNSEEIIKTTFSIEVCSASNHHGNSYKTKSCSDYKKNTILYFIVDGKLEDIIPSDRVKLITKLSDYFNIPRSVLTMKNISPVEIEQVSQKAIKYGYGNTKPTQSSVSSIQIELGCSGNALMMKYDSIVSQLKNISNIQVPLIKWMIVTSFPEKTSIKRSRRDLEGSADDEYYDAEYDEDDIDGDGVEEDVTAKFANAVDLTTARSVNSVTPADDIDDFVGGGEPLATQDTLTLNVSNFNKSILSSNKIDLSTKSNEDYNDYNEEGSEDNETVEATNIVPIVAVIDTNTPTSTVQQSAVHTPTTDDTELHNISMTPVTSSNLQPVFTSGIDMGMSFENVSNAAENTTSHLTTQPDIYGTTLDHQENLSNTTVFPSVTNHVSFAVPNQGQEIKDNAPIIQHRLQKLPVTAGKAFSFDIPENTFHDAEDGYNLRLSMHDMTGAPLQYSSWVQFDPANRRVYGLPLEEDISRYQYIITASDQQNASVSDILEITVQQHKGRRTVNHEITLAVQSEKRLKKNTEVDLRFRVLQGLAEVFGDPDFSQIIVTHVQTVVQPLQITWTNDSLPRNRCPREEIENLLKKVRQSVDSTEPTIDLVRAMAPELRVKSVLGGGVGACSSPDIPPPPKTPVQNFAPMPRNQVDHLNATVGQLLVYKVPEDSFYDPEDGNGRSLKMYLLNIDRAPLAPNHWLQFDTKNQEFYGIPTSSDIGHRQYLLVCEDRGGLTATDGLVVAVHPASKKDFMVEFQITLDIAYDHFINNANMQRKFVDKITELFNDHDSRYIKIDSIRQGSTIVAWRNTSLTGTKCLQNRIDELKSVLLREDDSLSHYVVKTMGSDFPVISAKMTPTGVCRGEFLNIHSPDTSVDIDSTITLNQDHDDYLITFVIPAIIIIGMIILASLIACLLYKKRRTGKMELGDEEERQSFRNKGIPVIFQDELEEKPDPSNKSPLILKDEKPPLHPPPEYKGLDSPQHADSDDNGPYQPPPPFTSSRSSESNRNNRPKPTPTYRKPPPYVPP